MSEFPLFEPLARNTDPWTSHAAKPDMVAHSKRSLAVWAVMQDGVGRTDEQIHAALVARGESYTSTSARHGRLTCARMVPPLIINSGRVAMSDNERATIVWIANPERIRNVGTDS